MKQYVNLTGKVASIFCAAGAMGDMTIIVLFARFIDEYPLILIYGTTVIIALEIVMFGFLQIYAKKYTVPEPQTAGAENPGLDVEN